jgi:hypothetical protein
MTDQSNLPPQRNLGPHGLALAPRRYAIHFDTPGGTSVIYMDGYSIEDAIRRIRKWGVPLTAAEVSVAERIKWAEPEGADESADRKPDAPWAFDPFIATRDRLREQMIPKDRYVAFIRNICGDVDKTNEG